MSKEDFPAKRAESFPLRLLLEEREARFLAPQACLSARSRGRVRPESGCSLRMAFQRDRDRIVHCKSFRRLKHKTQVFLSPNGDHYRTRLTHTLEVAQIARTIGRALALNEDLVEARRAGPRSRPYRLRTRRGECFERDRPGGIFAQRTESARGRASGKRGEGSQPDLRGARRHTQALQRALQSGRCRKGTAGPSPWRVRWCASPISWPI